jgi:hypothetical protein
MKKIPAEGLIERDGSGYVVRMKGATHLAELPGVVCENPSALEAQRVYSKRFVNKRIYMPNQYKQAVAEVLTGTDVVVIGMNGYSELKAEVCRAWGVQVGAYEAACEGMLITVLAELLASYPGIDLRLADGASNVGVDAVLLRVAKSMNLAHLGHSCPRFMFYVEDDSAPVFVAKSKALYAEAFIDSLQILIAANGRMQAFEHDIAAVFKKRKRLVPVNVLKSISTNGGPQAFGPDGAVEDAVAALEECIYMVGHTVYGGRDSYRSIAHHVSDCAAAITRRLISNGRAYQPASLVRH